MKEKNLRVELNTMVLQEVFSGALLTLDHSQSVLNLEPRGTEKL